MNRRPDKRIGLRDRQRILELANQGLPIPQIAERLSISSSTTKKVLAQGLRGCAQCGRLADTLDLCPVCSLPVDAPLPERLKAFRTVADLSQLSLALKIGVHEHRVLNWEKGRTQPNEREVKMLAEGLGLTVHELIGALFGREIGRQEEAGCGADPMRKRSFCRKRWVPAIGRRSESGTGVLRKLYLHTRKLPVFPATNCQFLPIA
jgi:transcriptional regulator with XRE-family HTH domain